MVKGSTTGKVKAYQDEAPHHGFDRALKKALSQLSSDVGVGKYSVRVEFSLGVDVSNPGNIGWFKATLTSP